MWTRIVLKVITKIPKITTNSNKGNKVTKKSL